MIYRLLFTKTDNAPLVVFRILFGILIAFECYGAILTGWVKRSLIDPKFTFTFIGFEWLQPLPGNGMYIYFLIMGTLGICVALGFFYRISIISFTLMWTAVYLMQKTSYNNHYYLLILISGFMVFFPAHRYFSVDAWLRPSIRSGTMPSWVKWSVVLQLFILYTYAAIAKMYGDWLDFGVIKVLLQNKANFWLIGSLLQEPWLHGMVGILGILYDLTIIPALLWKRSRKVAFVASIIFHLFNSIVFQIGIFPYLSLAFTLFFFEPENIRNIFFKKKPWYHGNEIKIPLFRKTLISCLSFYFLVQLALPIRHYFIKGDVFWTEEGHRMSWRMMLRSRAGKVQFKMVNKKNGESKMIVLEAYLSRAQNHRIGAYPDFIWQFAQYLKKEEEKKGEAVSVYALNSKVSINGRPYSAFIDPNVDLASEKWDPFRHHDWILPSPRGR